MPQQNNGTFSGNPKTKWLTNKNSEDRDMMLLEDFFYIDPDGKKWNAPEGSIINGASIPKFLWNTIGSPYTGNYRRASIVHDVACDNAEDNDDRKAADFMFYHACLAGGCSVAEAQLLYQGVRIGSTAWALGITEDILGKELVNPKLREADTTLSIDQFDNHLNSELLSSISAFLKQKIKSQ